MKNEYIYASDLHIEKYHNSEWVLNILNAKITDVRNNKKNPIVILAGDIDNPKNLENWINKVEAGVVYVPGNHEFWEHDFEDVFKIFANIKKQDFYFLYNDFVIINGDVIVGATLWTDLGKSYNAGLPSIITGYMNDDYKIRYNNWFKDEANIGKLENFYEDYSLENIVNKKLWNTVIKLEENEKSFDFFNNMLVLIDIVKKNNFENFNEEKYEKILKIYGLKNLDLYMSEKWIKIAKTLSNLNAKSNVVVVSHHVPFLEEIFVGKSRGEKEGENYKINKNPDDFFYKRSGENFNPHYIMNCAKGRVERLENINHIFNYFNDGLGRLDQRAKEVVDVWIHGHEHYMNGENKVAGIDVKANPIGFNIAKEMNLEAAKKLIRNFNIKHKQKNEEIFKENINFLRSDRFKSVLDLIDEIKIESKNILKLWRSINEDSSEIMRATRSADYLIKEVKKIFYDYDLLLKIKFDSEIRMSDILYENANPYYFKYMPALKTDMLSKIDTIKAESKESLRYDLYKIIGNFLYAGLLSKEFKKMLENKNLKMIDKYDNNIWKKGIELTNKMQRKMTQIYNKINKDDVVNRLDSLNF